jgi:UDPglucose 6-dehydrogenase
MAVLGVRVNSEKWRESAVRITVIGVGYVGLVSAVCFSEVGFDVTCIDKDRAKLDQLALGKVPIFEPGLEELLQRNMLAGRLNFTGDMKQAVSAADVVFIAVGTPSREGDGAADATFVDAAAREVAEHLEGFTVIAIKSTVPVGTCRKIEQLIRDTNPAADLEIASNPEFLREGTAIDDFMRPDRIVIGTASDRACGHMELVYKPLSHRDIPMLYVSLESAELTKYAANAFLAMKVTYINQIADLCEAVGANAEDVAKGMGLDDRIGPRFLKPGPGIGGSCFPKDTRALSALAREAGTPLTTIDTVVVANETRKQAMSDRIIEAMGGDVAGAVIGVLGVSFKPDTDDMREAPALEIIPRLLSAGAAINGYDPAAMENAAKALPDAHWCDNPYDAARQADALVIMTEWNEFRALDLHRIADIMRKPLLIDLRAIYSPDEVADTDLIYHSVGRAPILPGKLKIIKTVTG